MTSQRSLETKFGILRILTLSIAVFTILMALAAPAQQAIKSQPSGQSPAAPVQADQARILDSYGKLPLSFEANQGQTDARVKFLSRTSGYSLFLTEDEAVLTLRGSKPDTNRAKIAGTAHAPLPGMIAPKGGVLRMKLRNANPVAKVTGVDELPGTSNYFIGNDPAKWRTRVPTYAKVKYEGIYSGINLIYYGNQRQLEYDFIVAPGADPHRIAFDVHGAKWIRRDQHGDLVLKMSGGEIRWHKPVVYQEKDGARQEIAARYAITTATRVGIELASYDPSLPLYIDPLIYSTFLGGTNYLDAGSGIAVDSAGNAYVAGYTSVGNFPVTPGAFQTSFDSQNEDAFVTKISPDGSTLVYSTFLGNGTWNWSSGIAVDSFGDAYVVGGTFSTDFPTTPGAFRTTCADVDNGQCVYWAVFVTEINPSGSALVYSTYLGDTGPVNQNFAIAVDSSGSAYVTGGTVLSDFPVTTGAFQTACNSCSDVYPYIGNAFVTKLNSSGSALIYSTYLGGSGGSDGSSIALDSADNAYVTGSAGPGFPTTPGAFQTTCGNPGTCGNPFVTKINPSGSGLVYSTYLNPSAGYFGISGNGIAVDSGGYAYVVGATNSPYFPTTPGAFQTIYVGSPCCTPNAFVTKFNPTGSALVYSTYLGGTGGAAGNSIVVDSRGDAYVTGSAGPGFPIKNWLQRPLGINSVFVTKFNPTGSGLVYSTLLGGAPSTQPFVYGNGIAVDGAGNTYVTGTTWPTNFPVTADAFQTSCSGTSCSFVTKLFVPTTTTTLVSSLNPSIYGQSITWTAKVTTSGSIPPTGEVNFTWGDSIGGAPLNASGVATLTRSTLNADAYPLTAVYGGDANNEPSTSSVLNEVIKETTSSATLTSSSNPSAQGQAVTFTATITSPTVTATGPVTFTAGKTALGTGLLSGGKATFTTSTLPIGTTPITASYYGDSNIAESSASVVQTVTSTSPDSTTTTLSASPNPSQFGEEVTFTAKVTSSPGAPPNGEIVIFYNGSAMLGPGVLNGGETTLVTSSLPGGTFSITAKYGGDPTFLGSTSSPLSQIVQTSTTAATVAWVADPPQNETFTATVTGPKGIPTGFVAFTVGSTTLGTVTLSGGVATLTVSTLVVGSNTVTATYSGDADNPPTSAWTTQTFVVPYNATMYLQQEGGYAAASTEFGSGTWPTNFVLDYSGMPNDPNPTGQVLVGSFTAGTIVNFGMFTQYGSQSGWAFSDEVGANQAALISFADLSNALGLNHSITQQTSSTTWVLWLDDAVSYLYDDDNNDVIMEIILVPN